MSAPGQNTNTNFAPPCTALLLVRQQLPHEILVGSDNSTGQGPYLDLASRVLHSNPNGHGVGLHLFIDCIFRNRLDMGVLHGGPGHDTSRPLLRSRRSPERSYEGRHKALECCVRAPPWRRQRSFPQRPRKVRQASRKPQIVKVGRAPAWRHQGGQKYHHGRRAHRLHLEPSFPIGSI